MKQPGLFDHTPTGVELRDRALDNFRRREPDWLSRARSVLVELLIRHPVRDVSSDDVWAHCPPPVDVHPSVMGAVFKDQRFVMTGWKASKRPSAHARVVRTYTLR